MCHSVSSYPQVFFLLFVDQIGQVNLRSVPFYGKCTIGKFSMSSSYSVGTNLGISCKEVMYMYILSWVKMNSEVKLVEV